MSLVASRSSLVTLFTSGGTQPYYMSTLGVSLYRTCQLLCTQRKIWLPFLLIAALQIGALLLVWLAAHPPLSAVLAPPIRYFFGSRVLHYPAHLWFLYHVMPLLHFVITLFIGAFLGGVACALTRQGYEGRPLALNQVFSQRTVRYGQVTLLWLLSWGAAKLLMRICFPSLPKEGFILAVAITLAITVQALLVYAIPASVFGRVPWWKALFQSVRETFNHPVITFIVVLIPGGMVLAFSIFASEAKVGDWMIRVTPEIAIAFVAIRILIWTLADAFMTVGAATLWCVNHSQPVTRSDVSVSAGTVEKSEGGTKQIKPPQWNRRKSALAGIGAILGTTCFLVLSGCSADYNGERLYWKANQVKTRLMASSTEATPEQVAMVIAAYKRVIDGAPGTLWAARAHTVVGSFYAQRQQFDPARALFTSVLRNYSEFTESCLTARISLAQISEAQLRWDEMTRLYQEIATLHPWSKSGLEAPLYVGGALEKAGKTQEAAGANQWAVSWYEKLLEQAPRERLGLYVKSYLAVAYQKTGQWQQSAQLLESIAQTPETEGVIDHAATLWALGSLYENQLNDGQRAAAIFNQLVERYPDHAKAQEAKLKLSRELQ